MLGFENYYDFFLAVLCSPGYSLRRPGNGFAEQQSSCLKRKHRDPLDISPSYSHLPTPPYQPSGTVVGDRCYRLPNCIKLCDPHLIGIVTYSSDTPRNGYIHKSHFQCHRPTILLCKFIPSYYELLLSKI
jgi:hypothetical protein